MAETVGVETVAEAYLCLLKARGIDWLFANAGTDFAPIIEALSRGAGAGLAMPEPLAVPHETVAVGMAHGYYLASGRPQAVMVHVNVGMANALMGLLNAARDNVPILFTSGARRSPSRAALARATCRSTGARRCTTRAACCASTSNGITNCATAISSSASSIARLRSR